MGFHVSSEYVLEVNDVAASADAEGYTTRSKANDWVASGISEFYNGDNEKVTNPDYHSVSWLTYDEFGKAIQKYLSLSQGHFPASYVALYAHMSVLESCGDRTRVIFWFDN